MAFAIDEPRDNHRLAQQCRAGDIILKLTTGHETVPEPVRWHRLRSDPIWTAAVAGIAAAIGAAFFFIVYGIADEGVLLNAADRLAHGQRLYVDFFEFLPPGGFLLTSAWLSMAGHTIEAARLLALLSVVTTSCFCFLACRRAGAGRATTLFLITAWLMMSQPETIAVWHHWFTTAFSMIAAWAALAQSRGVPPRRSNRYAWCAGLAGGMAAMITPTRGALSCLAALAMPDWRSSWRSTTVSLAIGMATVPLLALLYLIATDSLGAAASDVIGWTGSRYADIQAVPWGAFSSRLSRPLVYVFPMAGILLLVALASERSDRDRSATLRVAVAFAFAGFIGCFPRPDSMHIAANIPLALPLVGRCLARLARQAAPAVRVAVATAIATQVIAPAIIFARLVDDARGIPMTQTPRGRVKLIREDGLPEMMALVAKLPAGDGMMFYPNLPMMPFLTDRRHIARLDVFFPQYTTAAQYRAACFDTVAGARWLVIDRAWNAISIRNVYPATADANPPEKVAFEHAIAANYELASRRGMFDLLRRRPDAALSDCRQIGGG